MSIKVSSSFEVIGGAGGVTSTVTSSTAAGGMTAQQLGQQNEVAAFKSIYTNYVEAASAKIEEIESKSITTENISASIANIDTLNANDAIVKNIFSEDIVSDSAILKVLQTNVVNADVIKSATAEFGYITVDKADSKYANITLANIDTANINKEAVGQLFAEIGILQNVTIKNGAVTGELNGVKIHGDLIDANTLAADRLILRGENGLVYEINAPVS